MSRSQRHNLGVNMKIINFVLASILFIAPCTLASGSHSGGHVSSNHSHPAEPARSGNQDRHDHAPDHRRDGRTFGRDYHHRIDRAHDVRIVDGHQWIVFGGVWFTCGYQEWPVWVWSSDVYVVEVGPDIYEMYSFSDPTMQISIYVAE